MFGKMKICSQIIARHYVNCFAARYDRTRASKLCKPLILECDSSLHNLFAAVYINKKSRFYSASLTILNILTIATIAIIINTKVLVSINCSSIPIHQKNPKIKPIPIATSKINTINFPTKYSTKFLLFIFTFLIFKYLPFLNSKAIIS